MAPRRPFPTFTLVALSLLVVGGRYVVVHWGNLGETLAGQWERVVHGGTLARTAGTATVATALVTTGLEDAPERPNLLVVTLCSLRADRVGHLGYPHATTPNLDALAAAGTTFPNAFSNATFTLAAHASLLTGLLPGPAGVFGVADTIRPSVPTLPEILGWYGYQTAAYAQLAPGPTPMRPPPKTIPGTTRPWEMCTDTLSPEGAAARASAMHASFTAGAGQERGFDHFYTGLGSACNEAVATELSATEAPFFAVVHIKDAHSPYGHSDRDPRLKAWMSPQSSKSREAQAEADATLVASLRADPVLAASFQGLYDAAVTMADAELGRLLDVFAARGLLDDTVVVVVGDHGEALGEGGVMGHSGFLRPEVLRVPLVIKEPGQAPGRVEADVSLVDVAATLLERGGAVAPAGLHGRSLVPALRGETLRPAVVVAQAPSKDLPPIDVLAEAIIATPNVLRYVPQTGGAVLLRMRGDGWEAGEADAALSAGLLAGRDDLLGGWSPVAPVNETQLTPEQLERMHGAGYW